MKSSSDSSHHPPSVPNDRAVQGDRSAAESRSAPQLGRPVTSQSPNRTAAAAGAVPQKQVPQVSACFSGCWYILFSHTHDYIIQYERLFSSNVKAKR